MTRSRAVAAVLGFAHEVARERPEGLVDLVRLLRARGPGRGVGADPDRIVEWLRRGANAQNEHRVRTEKLHPEIGRAVGTGDLHVRRRAPR